MNTQAERLEQHACLAMASGQERVCAKSTDKQEKDKGRMYERDSQGHQIWPLIFIFDCQPDILGYWGYGLNSGLPSSLYFQAQSIL